jgi:hypothetical protein
MRATGASAAIVIIAVLPLVGCASAPPPPAPKPVSEMTPAERCANLAALMGNPWLQPFQQAAAYEKARNEGCMGTPQPQTVIMR